MPATFSLTIYPTDIAPRCTVRHDCFCGSRGGCQHKSKRRSEKGIKCTGRSRLLDKKRKKNCKCSHSNGKEIVSGNGEWQNESVSKRIGPSCVDSQQTKLRSAQSHRPTPHLIIFWLTCANQMVLLSYFDQGSFGWLARTQPLNQPYLKQGERKIIRHHRSPYVVYESVVEV